MTKPTNAGEPRLLLIWDESPESIITFLLPVDCQAAQWARKFLQRRGVSVCGTLPQLQSNG